MYTIELSIHISNQANPKLLTYKIAMYTLELSIQISNEANPSKLVALLFHFNVSKHLLKVKQVHSLYSELQEKFLWHVN